MNSIMVSHVNSEHKAAIVTQTCLQLNCNLELADRIGLSGAAGFSFRVSFRVTRNKLNSSP
jgi:hypothetical protein